MIKLAGRHSAPTLSYIYDILIKEAGAMDGEYDRQAFVNCALDWDYNFNFEYRFMGKLGRGGKVWLPMRRDPYVSCYPEDSTPERKALIEVANKELSSLVKEQKGV